MKKFLLTTLKLLVFFIGWAVTAGLLPVPCENDPVLWRFFAELIPFAALAVFTSVFIIAEKGEVKIPCLRSFVKAAVSGTLTGALWIGAAVGIMLVYRDIIDNKGQHSYFSDVVRLGIHKRVYAGTADTRIYLSAFENKI